VSRRLARRPQRSRARSALLVAGAAALLAGGCARGGSGAASGATYVEARAVIDRHCVSCHSQQPTIPAFPLAPNGLELDTAQQMRQNAALIKERTIVDKSMPLLNRSGMTEAERGVLQRWIDGGAPTP
jgi:uncharacterized membrane protein